MRVGLLATFVILIGAGAAAGVLYGPVTGSADLDLSGTIYYAMNLGDTADRPVAGVWFDADNDGRTSPGYSVVGPNTYTSGWGYGSIADPNLRSVYDTMRWRAGAPVEVTLRNLPPRQQVTVQLLLSEGYWSNSSRRYDIEIEGVTEFVNVDPYALWGSKTPGLGTATVTVSADGILNVRLIPTAGTPDPNPALDGIIVSAPGGTPVLGRRVPLAAGQVSASAIYNGLFPAAAAVDGSWAETPIGSVYDFWLLPNSTAGYLQFDLGERWMLETMQVHNTDNRTYHDRGTIAYHVDISPDPTFALSETIASGTLATYAGGWLTIPLQSDEFWRYARFYVDDFGGSLHWGQDASVHGGGIAEIRFYGSTPEPTTLALLAFGTLGMLTRRRKK